MLERSSSVPALCPAGVVLSGVEDRSLPRPVPCTGAGCRDSPVPEVCIGGHPGQLPSGQPGLLPAPSPGLPVLGSRKDSLSGLLPGPEPLLSPKLCFCLSLVTLWLGGLDSCCSLGSCFNPTVDHLSHSGAIFWASLLGTH